MRSEERPSLRFHLSCLSSLAPFLKKGWTHAELARRVGMQQPNIARLEGRNYDRVSLPTLKKVARALGAEIEIKLSA